MNITTVHEPDFEPVTLLEVYNVLHVDPEGSPLEHPLDADFARQITASRRNVEQQTRRSLIRQTLRLSMADFPSTCGAVRAVRLYRPPVIMVESVAYYDADNAQQTVSAANYYLTDEQVPELRFVLAFSAPTLYDRPDAVRVTYVAGYIGVGSPASTQAEAAEHVPAELKEAVLVGVQMLQVATSPQDYELLQRMQRAMLHPYIVQLAV